MRESPLEPVPAGLPGTAAPETVPAASAKSAGWYALWKRWLSEPLVHFLLIGMALFVAYRALNPAAVADARTNVIELTQDDLFQMSVVRLAQGRPAPTPDEMRHLVEAKVREEILYREALALGLDKGDTIVKRRLAQKMEFLAEDVAAVSDPASGELEAWFEKNAERFAVAPRVSFRHLYFSPDRRGSTARGDAERALARLSEVPDDASVAALSDPFMFQEHYGDRSPEQLAKLFGPAFAREIFKLAPGLWQGPIESGYGWHLVFADTVTPRRLPAFEEVETEVKVAWVEEQRAISKRKMYEAMRARYQVVLPEVPVRSVTGTGPTAVTNR
jgi:peptidyl-prolyl cis-trans isomerase C